MTPCLRLGMHDEMAMTKDLTLQMWIYLLDLKQNRVVFAKQN